MMPAAKHFDPVLGVDVHIILIPTPAGPVPTPIPHPFVGFILDPFDYVPIIGGTILVNGMQRATAGTGGKAVPLHIPIGGPFAPPPPSNECEMFMGSMTVDFDGEPASYMALPALSCQSIGMPPGVPPRPKRKFKMKSMRLPTSVVLPIPLGMPVLIGGPPTISLMGAAMAGGMTALGALGKGVRRLQRGSSKVGRFFRTVSAKAHKVADAVAEKLRIPPRMRNAVSNGICTVTGHPVDVATGKVFTEMVDFELPGPIPIKWERIWFSTSTYAGPLGHGWHHGYDLALIADEESGTVAVRMSDGRPVAFPLLALGETAFDRKEKLILFRDERGYALRNAERLIFRFQPSSDPSAEQRLASIEDTSGHAVQFNHDGAGRLTKIVASGGRTLRLDHDQLGRITALHAPHPDQAGEWFRAAGYTYDDVGDLIEVVDALGHSTRYDFRVTVYSPHPVRSKPPHQILARQS